jgi:hypothetical protein
MNLNNALWHFKDPQLEPRQDRRCFLRIPSEFPSLSRLAHVLARHVLLLAVLVPALAELHVVLEVDGTLSTSLGSASGFQQAAVKNKNKKRTSSSFS